MSKPCTVTAARDCPECGRRLIAVSTEAVAADILAGAAVAKHRLDIHPCPICGLSGHIPDGCPNRRDHPIEASAFDIVRWDN